MRCCVSVSKTPPGEEPFDPKPAKEACRAHEEVGMFVYHLVDEIAERFLDLIDSLDEEIDELEDLVAEQHSTVGRQAPARAAARRARTSGGHSARPAMRCTRSSTTASSSMIDELFPRTVEISFTSAYDKFLRASEALDSSRDSLGGVRDYLQGKISNDQNEVMKRLTLTASLLLVPTFIVGLYGQNFRRIPEIAWGFGYWWSWGWIIATTIAQLAFFKWKKWI